MRQLFVRPRLPSPAGLLPMLYLALLLVLCAALVWRPLTASLDFWGHAAVGRWMCQHGEIPHHTLFLWTASEPWVAHSWLTQLTFYSLTRIGGEGTLPYVVLAFTIVLTALPFVLVWQLWGRRGHVGSWVILPFFLALDLAYPRFQTRPELFTVFFLVVLLRLLVAWSAPPAGESGKSGKRMAVAVFLLFVTWANFHGAVVIGLLLLGVTVACDLLQDRFDRRSRLLVLLVPLAAVAATINPFGLSYWRAFRPVSGRTFARIEEWRPVWQISPLPERLLIEEGALLVLAVLAWASNPRRRWSHLGWLLVVGGLFVMANRNSWPLALVSLTVTAANAGRLDPAALWQVLERKFARRPDGRTLPPPISLRWTARAVLLVWLCLQIFARWHALQIIHSLVPDRLTAGALRFVHEEELAGRVCNDYENSSFMHWSFAGRPELFIDLMNAYPDRVTRDYIDIVNVNARGRRLLEDGTIDWFLLTTNRPGPSLGQLADYLDKSSDWLRIYADGDGAIWVRRTPEARRRWGARARKVIQTSFRTLEAYNYEAPP